MLTHLDHCFHLQVIWWYFMCLWVNMIQEKYSIQLLKESHTGGMHYVNNLVFAKQKFFQFFVTVSAHTVPRSTYKDETSLPCVSGRLMAIPVSTFFRSQGNSPSHKLTNNCARALLVGIGQLSQTMPLLCIHSED